MENCYTILLIFNILIYGFCCLMILKRKNYTCISIRTPILLLTNNLSGFFLTTIIILNKILNCSILNFINQFFYLFQTMMFISFIMRCQRIITCCGIKNDEREDIKLFYNKRYLFQEIYYVKLMLKCLLIVVLVLVCVFFIYKPISFISLVNDENKKFNQIIWLFIIFIECGILITYTYLMMIDTVKENIKFELIFFLITWFIYWNLINWIYFSNYNNKNAYSLIISLVALYFCLFINGFFPIILSFCYSKSIPYLFNPNLMNDLYSFLTNEECYNVYSNFLYENYNKDLFYLNVYTHILNYKLLFFSEESNDIINDESNEIFNKYFEKNNLETKFPNEVINEIRRKFDNLDNYKNEIFDSAFKLCFINLGKRFLEFKNTKEFQNLYEYLNLLSYIQCKMSNTGLINKF